MLKDRWNNWIYKDIQIPGLRIDKIVCRHGVFVDRGCGVGFSNVGDRPRHAGFCNRIWRKNDS